MTEASQRMAAERKAPRRRHTTLLLTGVCVVAYAAFLAWLAHRFDADQIGRESALLLLASGSALAGALYLVGLFRACRRLSEVPWMWIGTIAVLARLIVIASPPLLESDYQRYLWDGAVVANGVNPYRHAPGDIAAGSLVGSDADLLRNLAADAGPVLSEINHPHLTSVYPSVAQASFALAHVIEPFGVTGWRLVLLLADVVTAVLLVRLLRVLGLPVTQIVWYAWNPLLLRETYSSLHMDMLVLPLVVGAVLAGVRARSTLGAALCVVGSAVKVWPIMLIPIFLRPLISHWRSLLGTLALAFALFAALWFPVLAVPHEARSGFVAYGQGWQNNDGFFRAGIWLTERILNVSHVQPWHSHAIMRVVSAFLLITVVGWQAVGRRSGAANLPRQCLFVVGAVFLLSPTQFPWYWLWCLPLLTLRPSLPLLLYTVLLPLYYIQFRTQAVFWIEHVPVWGLLALHLVWAPRGTDQPAKIDLPTAHA